MGQPLLSQSMLNAAINIHQSNAIAGNFDKQQKVVLTSANTTLANAEIVEENAVITESDATNRTVRLGFNPLHVQPGDSIRIFNVSGRTVVVHPPNAATDETGHRLSRTANDGTAVSLSNRASVIFHYEGQWEIAANTTRHLWTHQLLQ